MSSTNKPLCISIGPFGTTDIDQQHRKNLEIVLRECVEPNFEYKPFWALPKMDMAADIFKALVEADLVIADLRGLNPNVMYELGLRHAFNKPILHLIDPHTDLPWDIDKNFTLKYPLPIQVSDKESLVKTINEKIEHILSIKKDKNPSFNTFQRTYRSVANIDRVTADVEIKDVLKNMSQQLQQLTSRMDTQEVSQRPRNPWSALQSLTDTSQSTYRIHDYSIPESQNLNITSVPSDFTGMISNRDYQKYF